MRSAPVLRFAGFGSAPALVVTPSPPPGAPAVESAPSSLVGLDPELPAGTAGLLAPCVGGVSVLPYHPYTQASAKPVTPGTVTEYQIQIFPTLATIAAGNQLRLTSQRQTPRTWCRCPGSFPSWLAVSTRSRAQRPLRRRSRSRRSSSVERARIGGYVDRVLLEQVERHEIERALVGRGEDDEGGDALLVRPQPRLGRHAPAVAGLKAGKVVLGRRRAQVVPDAPLILEELPADDGADRVTPEVTGTGAAAPSR